MVASSYCIWTLSKSDNKLLTLSTLCMGTSYSTCFVCLSVCYATPNMIKLPHL